MNDSQKKAAEYAEILLAFSRGEKLQIRRLNGKWKDRSAPDDIPDLNCEYRIAPKPVEAWIRWGGLNEHCSYETKEKAEKAALQFGGRAVLMREVTE